MITALRPKQTFTTKEYKMPVEETGLTPLEQKLFDALCLVNTESYYGKVILDVFVNFSVKKFRELQKELLQQRDDASYEVYKMLGKNVCDCLDAIKISL